MTRRNGRDAISPSGLRTVQILLPSENPATNRGVFTTLVTGAHSGWACPPCSNHTGGTMAAKKKATKKKATKKAATKKKATKKAAKKK